MIIDKPVEVDALDFVDGLTINVRVTNLWRLRLGVLFLKLAARVLRCDIEMTAPPTLESPPKS